MPAIIYSNLLLTLLTSQEDAILFKNNIFYLYKSCLPFLKLTVVIYIDALTENVDSGL